MLASALFRMTRPPVGVGGLAMLWGYIRSMAQRKQRYGDAQFRSFLRRYQWRCLLAGKRRATQELNQRQASQWRPPAGAGARADSTHPSISTSRS
jgi:hypothetical protein